MLKPDLKDLKRVKRSTNLETNQDVRWLKDILHNSHEGVRRLAPLRRIERHRGCVNSVAWNLEGTRLLSGSDDKCLCIADAFQPKHKTVKNYFKTSHRKNIFSAKFLPFTGDLQVLSCSSDGSVYHTFVDRLPVDNEVLVPGAPAPRAAVATPDADSPAARCFNCHLGTCYDVAASPAEPKSFLTAGEDGTVRWIDLRIKDSCSKRLCTDDILINCRRPVTALDLHPTIPWEILVGCSDSTVRVYDRRMLGTKATLGCDPGGGHQGMQCSLVPPSLSATPTRITSAKFNVANPDEVLASYSSDRVYLFDLKNYGDGHEMSISGSADAKAADDEDADDGCDFVYSSRYQDNNETKEQEKEKKERIKEEFTKNDLKKDDDDSKSESNDAKINADTLEKTVAEVSAEGKSPEADTASGEGRPTSGAEGKVGDQIERQLGPGIPHQTETPDARPKNPTTTRDQKATPAPRAALLPTPRFATGSGAETAFDVFADLQSMEQQRIKRFRFKGDWSDTGPKARPRGEHEPQGGRVPLMQRMSDLLSQWADDPNRLFSAAQTASEQTRDSATQVTTSGDLVARVIQISAAEGADAPEQATANPAADSTQTDDLSAVPAKATNDVSEGDSSETSDSRGRSSTNESPLSAPSSSVLPQSPLQIAASEILSEIKGETRDAQNHVSRKESFGRQQKRSRVRKRLLESILSPERKRVDGACSENTKDSEPAPEMKPDPISNGAGITDEPRGVEAGARCETKNTKLEEDKKGEEEKEEGIGAGDNPDSDAAVKRKTRFPSEKENVKPTISSTAQAGDSSGHRNATATSSSSPHLSPSFRLTSPSRSASQKIEDFLRRKREREMEKLKNRETDNDEEEFIRALPKPKASRSYSGHRNSRTMIKEAGFWGDDHVMSGSDCGHIFFWDKRTGEVVNMIEADHHVVNCLQPHPSFPILASSGIDYDVKLWAPTNSEPKFDKEYAREIIERNRIMLEETKNTITIPAFFMFRLLASLTSGASSQRNG